jgi:hypothetical protein
LAYSNERPFFTGNQYTTKELILSDAYDVALSKLCDCFKQSDIVAGIQNSEKLVITEEQKTALRIALNVLNSGSEQQQIAAFYIKQLIEKV